MIYDLEANKTLGLVGMDKDKAIYVAQVLLEHIENLSDIENSHSTIKISNGYLMYTPATNWRSSNIDDGWEPSDDSNNAQWRIF